MSYTIDYSTAAPALKYARALSDALEWLGDNETKVRKCLHEYCRTLPQARMALSFAGLQGLPARVYFRHINRTQ